MLAWGAGASGQLGNGTTTDAGTPVAVLGVGGTGTLDNATVVAAGGDSSYAVRADGTVAAWGDGEDGALGNGSTAGADVPMLVSGVGGTGSLSGITSVAGGEFDGLALTSGGSVDAWGLQRLRRTGRQLHERQSRARPGERRGRGGNALGGDGDRGGRV